MGESAGAFRTYAHAMDNTLPQAADSWLRPYGFVRKRRDPFALYAFEDFVNAFATAPRLLAPIPGQIETGELIDEPLILLWQDAARVVPDAEPGRASIRAPSYEEVWEAFREALLAHPKPWIEWVAFQWTPEIVPAFTARVRDWKKQLEKSADSLRSLDGRLRGTEKNRLREVIGLMQRCLNEGTDLPAKYGGEASRLHQPLEWYALGYAFNWFRRGASYKAVVRHSATKFHYLRYTAPASVAADESLNEAGYEPPWGRIVRSFIAEGLVKREPETICRLLRKLRKAVTQQRELLSYKAGLRASALKGEKWRRQNIALVTDTLLKAGLPPVFRGLESYRAIASQLGTEIQEVTSEAVTKPKLLVAITYRVLTWLPDTRLVRSTAARTLRRSSRIDLWNVMRIPGVN